MRLHDGLTACGCGSSQLLGLLDELDAKHGAPEKAVAGKIKRDARRIFRR
jgi:hypothetical protein